MKRKYYFHRVNQPLQADTVIYRLWVGESIREQSLLTRLLAWSFANGATLTSWSEDVDYYIEYESERVFPGSGLLDFGFIQRDITAREALEHIEANDWDIYEKNLPQPKSFFASVRLNSPYRLNAKKGSIAPSRVLTEKSKNLSHAGEGLSSIIKFN